MNSVAIIGSREWPSPKRVESYINELPDNTVVITGAWWAKHPQGADVLRATRGVDITAALAARARGLTVVLVGADFDRYAKGAGLRRNPVIIALGDRTVAFWSGESKGTKNAIDHADRLGKDCKIITV